MTHPAPLSRHTNDSARRKLAEGPSGGVEGFVVAAYDVDLLEDFQRDFAPIEVGYEVGGEVRDFDFDPVGGGLESVEVHDERRAPERAEIAAIEADAGGLPDAPKIERPCGFGSGGASNVSV